MIKLKTHKGFGLLLHVKSYYKDDLYLNKFEFLKISIEDSADIYLTYNLTPILILPNGDTHALREVYGNRFGLIYKRPNINLFNGHEFVEVVHNLGDVSEVSIELIDTSIASLKDVLFYPSPPDDIELGGELYVPVDISNL